MKHSRWLEAVHSDGLEDVDRCAPRTDQRICAPVRREQTRMCACLTCVCHMVVHVGV